MFRLLYSKRKVNGDGVNKDDVPSGVKLPFKVVDVEYSLTKHCSEENFIGMFW